MRAIISTCVALALTAQVALAADIKSGPQKGALLGPFEVTKVAAHPMTAFPRASSSATAANSAISLS